MDGDGGITTGSRSPATSEGGLFGPASPPATPQEIFNKTIRVARGVEAAPSEERFEVPEGYSRVLVLHQAIDECPVGYYRNAQLRVTSIDVGTTSFPLFPGSSNVFNVFACASGTPRPVRSDEVTAKAGQWKLDVQGEYTGSARIMIRVE